MSTIGWRVHGDGRRILPGAVVNPDERLSWPRTVGIGMQHVVAMFGATILVPTAEKNSVVEAGNPVIAGTRIVEPHIATTCCMPIPTVRGQLNRSSGLTTAPGRIRRPSPCTRHPIAVSYTHLRAH